MDNIDTNKLLQPDIVHFGTIEIFENSWIDPEKTIEAIENECEDPYSELSWKDANVRQIDGEYGKSEKRSNLEARITETAERGDKFSQRLHNEIADMIDCSTVSYMYRHKIYGVPYHHEYYHILKYSQGQKFDAHVDGMPGGARFLSAICYLNNDFEGGELEFPNFDLTIKPKAGSLILFPSYFPFVHTAHPVTKGTKYSIVAWLGAGIPDG